MTHHDIELPWYLWLLIPVAWVLGMMLIAWILGDVGPRRRP
jgi:hypothetical protein